MAANSDNDVAEGASERTNGRFYCCLSGVVVGPLRSRDVARLARKGALRADDGVREGLNGKWYPAGRVQGTQFAPSASAAAESPDQCFWFLEGSTLGPFSNRELRLLATSGRLQRDNYVRRGGGHRWRSVENLPELCRLIDRETLPADRPATSLAEVPANRLFEHEQPATSPGVEQSAAPEPARSLSAVPPVRVLASVSGTWSRGLFMAMLVIPFLIPPAGPELGMGGVTAAGVLGLIACIAVSYLVIRPQGLQPAMAAAVLGSGVVSVACLLKLHEFWLAGWEDAARQSQLNLGLSPTLVGLGIGSPKRIGSAIAAAILEVGLVEEAVKVLPVAAVAWTALRRGDVARVSFLACLSGLSFGICEGFVRSRDVLAAGPMPLSESIVRFVGAPLGHALFCWMSVLLACLISRGNSAAGASSGRMAVALLLSVLCSGVVHGTYDSLLILHMAGAAGIVMLGACVLTLEVWKRSAVASCA